MKNNELCPKCLGGQKVMESKQKRGFEYKTCSLCNGEGTVSSILADDFIFSLNENNYNLEN